MKILKPHLPVLNLYFMILIMPFITMFRPVTVMEEWQSVYSKPILADMYIDGKAILIVLLSAYGIISVIIKRRQVLSRLKSERLFLVLLIMLVSFVITTVLSEYPYTSVFGLIFIREGLIIWICYVILFIQSNSLIQKKHIHALTMMTLTAITIQSLIILSQYWGYDYIQIPQIRDLFFLPKYSMWKSATSITQPMTNGTLFNPNFIGSYTALILPVIYIFSKDSRHKALHLTVLLIGYAALLASKSSAGTVSFFIWLIIIAIAGRRSFFSSRFNKVFLAGILILSFVFSGSIASNIKKLSSPITQKTEDIFKSQTFIEGFIIQDNIIRILAKDAPNLNILNKGENILIFVDEDKNQLFLREDGSGGYIIDDPRYSYYGIKFYQDNIVGMSFNKKEIPVSIEGKTFTLLKQNLDPLPIEWVNRFGFNNYERIGSGRGYIWSRSIPMIKDHFYFGTGLTSYALEFPQHDLLGKLNFTKNPFMIIDKPHNFYLMLLITTGFYGLALYVVFTLSAVKLFWKNKSILHIAMMFSYACVLMFNDSMIFTTSLYFIFLGVFLSMDHSQDGLNEVKLVTNSAAPTSE